jgi:lysophospholipase L1-like esterase
VVAHRKIGGLAVKLVLLAGSLLFAFICLEGIVRLRQYLKYGSASPTVHDFTVDPVSGLKIPVPGSHRAGIAINSLGFRGQEITVPKPRGTVRLAFLGASTTFCAEVSSNELVWPHLVTKELQSRYPEVRFDYVNAAVPGYSTEETLRNLESRVAPLDPDVVVFYEATNELSGDTRELARHQGLLVENPDETSPLAEWSVLWFLLEKNWRVLQRQKGSGSAQTRLSFDPRELSRGFENRLEDLVRRAQEHAPIVALATFSHRIRHEQSDEEKLRASNTSLYYMPYMSVEGLLDGFDEYNRVIRDVALRRGAILVAGEDEIPGDSAHFADSVHFTDAGSRRMATRVARALSDVDAFQELVATLATNP